MFVLVSGFRVWFVFGSCLFRVRFVSDSFRIMGLFWVWFVFGFVVEIKIEIIFITFWSLALIWLLVSEF